MAPFLLCAANRKMSAGFSFTGGEVGLWRTETCLLVFVLQEGKSVYGIRWAERDETGNVENIFKL
jgi:hypothetical protein